MTPHFIKASGNTFAALAVGAAFAPSATAAVFTLDFQTPETGSNVTNGTVLNLPLGSITFAGNFVVAQGIELFDNSQPGSDKVLAFNDNGGYVYMHFGFAVDSISGMWGDRVGGTMQIEGLDINNNIVGYFFYAGGDGNWGSFSFDPSADIYSLRIADTSASWGELDNITITMASASAVPLPGAAGLAACGLLGLGRRRRR